MDNNELNIQLYQLLADWNPMSFSDPTLGDAEIYDVMDVIHAYDDEHEIALKIQSIYQFAFDETVQYEACLDITRRARALATSCQR